MFKIIAGLWLLFIASPAFAIGSLIAAYGLELVVAGTTTLTTWGTVVAMAINMVAASVISQAFFSPLQPANGEQNNPGNRNTIPPATDSKLPIVYGTAYVGGNGVDLSITEDNQNEYFVMALCEVTGGGTDTISFGDVYYGNKKVIFNSTNQYSVDSLLDESTGESQPINGNIEIYLYRDGSLTPTNSSLTAIQVMQSTGLVYTWNSQKQMTNCAFCILKLTYNRDLNVTALEQLRVQVINSRKRPGDCIYDYLNNSVYGCAIPTYQIDTASLDELNTYSDELIQYTTYAGPIAQQKRYELDGVLDTTQSVMTNLQTMATCCNALIKYNEILGLWGVITQKPTYTIAMDINDSNMISAISVTPIDLSNSFNIIECKFANKTSQDAFDAATYDLAQIAPTLLFANEPVNKQSVTLSLVNDSVRAQYLANIMLKAAREDLQLQVKINYVGLQLDAGDVVTVTNANYGWVAKEFRITKITQEFSEDGTVSASLILSEFNATVFSDVSVTQFTPAPNTGLASPFNFGYIPPPVIGSQYPTNTNPLFIVSITASSVGIIQYAEIWYSAFSNPTSAQRIFAGTSAIQSSGNPYLPNSTIPAISLVNIPSGNWYFFSRMVNSLATSPFSAASTIFRWRPSTFQYTERYVVVAYGDSITGTGFSYSPTNKTYYGLLNQASSTPSPTASDYTWYLADPSFGTNKYLCYSNRTGRKFSFATGFADYAAGTAAFVPTQTAIFDATVWSALPSSINYIDLDHSTGQVLTTGTTTTGTGEIAIINNPDGKIVASLAQYLDFGGPYQKTSAVATLTVDIYGRVVGFETPDAFYFTKQTFTATSGQTVFSVTRASNYISGQCLVFQNGLLLETSYYIDTGGSTGTVTFGTGVTLNDIITIVSFRSVNSSTGIYASFSRNTADLTGASTYTAGFTLNSGYELLFLNGAVVNDQDYDVIGQDITNFPSLVTGKLTILQWTANNLTTPNGNPVNVLINTIIGQTGYSFSYDVDAFNLYENGILLKQGTDYTTASNAYTLTNTPTTAITVLQQQTFSRTGAA